MRSGNRNRIISIKSKESSIDSVHGGAIDTWSTFTDVWAKVLPVSSKERISANSLNAEFTMKFNVRWISGVTSDINESMRVSYDGELYEITSVIDVFDNHKEIDILAKRLDT